MTGKYRDTGERAATHGSTLLDREGEAEFATCEPEIVMQAFGEAAHADDLENTFAQPGQVDRQVPERHAGGGPDGKSATGDIDRNTLHQQRDRIRARKVK